MKTQKEAFLNGLQQNLDLWKSQGLYKQERILDSPQGAEVVCEGRTLLNFCANNYLGLSGDVQTKQAAQTALERYGYGLSSVRFICGTQTVHKELEAALSRFLGTDDTILYAAAFDANGGVFEPLLEEQDALISDALNHASLIDGIRLCKAGRYRYAHNDMADLEAQLKQAAADAKRYKLIVTDGAFSMDGTIAQLDKICDLADRYEALVLVDDSHATGFIGKNGRGTPELYGVQDRVDLVTGTFGKALGGAMGGFTSGRREIIETLRQSSRPYLFSNTLAPVIAGTTLALLERLSRSTELRDRLHENTRYFRQKIESLGFTIKPGTHPIVPVMLFDAPLAQMFAASMYERGVLLTGFFYPVVPMGQARVRVQLSAAHTREQLDRALVAFEQTGRELGVL